MTVQMLDDLKDLGFAAATRAGISIGVDDMVIPAKKEEFLAGRPQGGPRGRRAAQLGRHHRG